MLQLMLCRGRKAHQDISSWCSPHNFQTGRAETRQNKRILSSPAQWNASPGDHSLQARKRTCGKEIPVVSWLFNTPKPCYMQSCTLRAWTTQGLSRQTAKGPETRSQTLGSISFQEAYFEMTLPQTVHQRTDGTFVHPHGDPGPACTVCMRLPPTHASTVSQPVLPPARHK